MAANRNGDLRIDNDPLAEFASVSAVGLGTCFLTIRKFEANRNSLLNAIAGVVCVRNGND